MERLTRLANNIPEKEKNRIAKYTYSHYEWMYSDTKEADAIQKLAAYEDAEEDGRLIVLPKNYDEIYNKRGDTIWAIIDEEATECVLTDIFIGKEHVLMIDCYLMEIKWFIEGGEPVEREEPHAYAFPVFDIGKTWFFTKEEAEATIAAMEEK